MVLAKSKCPVTSLPHIPETLDFFFEELKLLKLLAYVQQLPYYVI